MSEQQLVPSSQGQMLLLVTPMDKASRGTESRIRLNHTQTSFQCVQSVLGCMTLGGWNFFLANGSWHIAISTLQLLSGEILMAIREIA